MDQQLHEEATSRRRRVRRSAEQWAALIAAQAASGVSIAAFCRERGLAVSTFHAWRRRLGEERAAYSTERGFVRLRVGDEPIAEAGPSDSHRSGRHDGCVGDNQRDAEGNAEGEAKDRGDVDVPVQVRPVVVRFADGVEVHVDARQLAEVLTCLREGPTDGRSA